MDFDNDDSDRRLPIEPELDTKPDEALSEQPNKSRLLIAMALGGVIGTLVRVKIALLIVVSPAGIPWATFLVNTAGAFLLGLIMVLIADRHRGTPIAQAFFATGVCGSLTTFSTLVWQADNLARTGHWGGALLFILISCLAGLLAVFFGMSVGRSFGRKQVAA